MEIDRTGATRIVFVFRNVAVKVPNVLDGWKLFLNGLLSNIQERAFGQQNYDGLCPIVWSVPGGWLVVMKRARVMTIDEYLNFDAAKFCEREHYVIPSEAKSNSYGFIDNQVVAIDYG